MNLTDCNHQPRALNLLLLKDYCEYLVYPPVILGLVCHLSLFLKKPPSSLIFLCEKQTQLFFSVLETDVPAESVQHRGFKKSFQFAFEDFPKLIKSHIQAGENFRLKNYNGRKNVTDRFPICAHK